MVKMSRELLNRKLKNLHCEANTSMHCSSFIYSMEKLQRIPHRQCQLLCFYFQLKSQPCVFFTSPFLESILAQFCKAEKLNSPRKGNMSKNHSPPKCGHVCEALKNRELGIISEDSSVLESSMVAGTRASMDEMAMQFAAISENKDDIQS
jgi:hypothetical protein